MSKRRLGFALALGLVLVLFVSACGVAMVPVQFTAGGPAVLSPTFTGLQLPGFQHPAVMGTMHEVQRVQLHSAQSFFQFGVGGCHGVH